MLSDNNFGNYTPKSERHRRSQGPAVSDTVVLAACSISGHIERFRKVVKEEESKRERGKAFSPTEIVQAGRRICHAAQDLEKYINDYEKQIRS